MRPRKAVTVTAPSDITISTPSSPDPAVTVPSKIALSMKAPPQENFSVNILGLFKLISGVKRTETAAISPAPLEAINTSPSSAPPEFSAVEIPDWEISAATSVVQDVPDTATAPAEVTATTPPPGRIIGLVNGARKPMRVVHIIVRNLAAMATLAASIIMLFNEEEIHLSGFQLTANYKFSPAFKFFVIGNGVACIYAFVSMIIIICYGSNHAMHFFDMLMMGLVIAAAAAASAVSYIGKKGNSYAFWKPVCNYAEDFCYHLSVSIGCSYLGFFLLLLLFTLTFISKISRYNISAD